jgi:hypothetical protein
MVPGKLKRLLRACWEHRPAAGMLVLRNLFLSGQEVYLAGSLWHSARSANILVDSPSAIDEFETLIEGLD